MPSRIVLTLIAVAMTAGCGGGDGPRGSRIQVVAGFYPLAYVAERIGGDRVDVENLTPPGAEPHDLELAIRDIERVRKADLVLYLAGFQPSLERAAGDARGVALDLLDGAETTDPHVWLDPVRYAELAGRVGTAVRSSSDAFALDLETLDGEYRRGLADCDRRRLVTSHAAFGHLAGRYDLEQVAITGLSPEAEASAGDLERVVDAVRASGATTVFVEPLVSPRLAETVAREAGVRTAVLDPLEGLSEEELAHGENYFTVMRRNLETLREALGCR